jgi:hypothetical protein
MAWPSDWTDGERITAERLNAHAGAVKTWGGNVDTGGNALVVESGAPVDGDIPAGGIVAWLDEATDKLKFRVRYSNGTTLKSGEIALT